MVIKMRIGKTVIDQFPVKDLSKARLTEIAKFLSYSNYAKVKRAQKNKIPVMFFVERVPSRLNKWLIN